VVHQKLFQNLGRLSDATSARSVKFKQETINKSSHVSAP